MYIYIYILIIYYIRIHLNISHQHSPMIYLRLDSQTLTSLTYDDPSHGYGLRYYHTWQLELDSDFIQIRVDGETLLKVLEIPGGFGLRIHGFMACWRF